MGLLLKHLMVKVLMILLMITSDGIIFTFDGLQDYLKFFFPDVYSEDDDGEYDADDL
jgi:hypothetical protein